MAPRTRRPRLAKFERETERRIKRFLPLLATYRATETLAAFLWPAEARRVHSVIAPDTDADGRALPANDDHKRWGFAFRCLELEKRLRPHEEMP